MSKASYFAWYWYQFSLRPFKVLGVGALMVATVGAFGWQANHLTACVNSVHAGLKAEVFDSKAVDLFFKCTTTAERENQECYLLPDIAAQSLKYHDEFISTASQCVPVTFEAKN